MKRQTGFTLIELMVTLVIIGIIATFAVPSYNRSVSNSARKTDAMPALLDLMRAQENYFANNFKYAESLTSLKLTDPVITNSGYFSITAEKCEDDEGKELEVTACIELIATGIDGKGGYFEKNGIKKDAYLELDSLGKRSINGVDGWLK